MKKIAIVGIEGSGKTVMLAGLDRVFRRQAGRDGLV